MKYFRSAFMPMYVPMEFPDFALSAMMETHHRNTEFKRSMRHYVDVMHEENVACESLTVYVNSRFRFFYTVVKKVEAFPLNLHKTLFVSADGTTLYRRKPQGDISTPISITNLTVDEDTQLNYTFTLLAALDALPTF